MTKRDDIVWISKQPQRFLNGPRLAIFEEGAPVTELRKRFIGAPEHVERYLTFVAEDHHTLPGLRRYLLAQLGKAKR